MPRPARSAESPPEASAPVTVLASARTWMESDAVQQLRSTARLPGMVRAVGLPDLHPGLGTPIGAVFAAEGWVYPYLVGGDIGCGMSLTRSDLRRGEVKLDRWERRLAESETLGDPPDAADVAAWLARSGVPAATDEEGGAAHDAALGTIGLGNHFAEVQTVQEVRDAGAAAALGLERDRVVLLVHSGTRGLGESVLRAHVDRHAAGGLADGDPEQGAYLARHDRAVAWARANRALIARRFLQTLGTSGATVLDVAHNLVSSADVDGRRLWLHRKGATPAPAVGGPVVIAGSRGTLSYVVLPEGDGDRNLHTLAHGAGRKWKRSEAKGRLEGRYRAQDLTRTALGSRVICADRALLYEEAPAAYKDIEQVIADLVEAGVARVVAGLRPLLTYKVGAAAGGRRR
jgi:release factor H-coupled RctB family protein